MQPNDPITYFAETDHRKKVPFGIKASDRTKHIYVIGKTGMGKSTLLENMAIQDIQSGNGMAFVDPHGKTAELLLEYVPKDRLDDVIYFAPFDMDHPMSFNIMEDVGYDKRHLVANGLMSAFKKIWVDAWSARMEYILSNVIMALLEFPDATLLGVNRMLTDKGYRKAVVDNIEDPSVKSFWVDEYAKYTDRYTQDATPAIQNKVGQFTANPLIRNIIGQPKSSFDLREVMDNKKILIINLSKGRIGEGNANLLGSMMITKLYLAAMSRADLPEVELKKRPNFYLFVDEFQSFANESFADILSEARKYKLNLTIAHQYIEQMPEEVRSAVFGNVGTMISFRVGAYDADVLEKEYAPKFYAEDMVNLGFTQIYLKLMINGVSSQPFSATTLPPIQSPEGSYMDEVIKRSQQLYAKPRIQIQDEIDMWYAKDFTPKKPEKAKLADGVLSPFEEAKAKARAQAAAKEKGGVAVENGKLKEKTIPDNTVQPRRVTSERRDTERRVTPERRDTDRVAVGAKSTPVQKPPAPRQTMKDLKRETAKKEIEEQKKNTDSLKDALAQLLNNEKKDTSTTDDTKQKPMPKPAPRNDSPSPPNDEAQKSNNKDVTAKEEVVENQSATKMYTQKNTELQQKGSQPVLKPGAGRDEGVNFKNNNSQTASFAEIKRTTVDAGVHQKKERIKLRVPENPHGETVDKEFTPVEKTNQKVGEVPEEVLKKVLGI